MLSNPKEEQQKLVIHCATIAHHNPKKNKKKDHKMLVYIN